MGKLNIIAVQVQDGYYFSRGENISWAGILIDGEPFTPTFHSDWIFNKTVPQKISRMIRQPNINFRYELQDKSLASKSIPEIILQENAMDYKDDERYWKEEYRKYSSLYQLVSDEQPSVEEVMQFDFKVVAIVKKITSPANWGYEIESTDWDGHISRKEISSKNVDYSLLDKIFYPAILLPSRPCSLTSKQLYNIVREYVKKNINPRYAEITSDYDFCFTVQKKIDYANPQSYTIDLGKRRQKTVTRYRTSRHQVCFEMTNSEDNYRGYAPISGIAAENQEVLKEKIDKYLADLMTFINKPLIDCPHCNGLGVVEIANKPEATK